MTRWERVEVPTSTRSQRVAGTQGEAFIVEFAPVHPNVLTLAFAPEAADDTPDATPVPDGEDDSSVTALPSTATGDAGIDGGAMALTALASPAVISLGAVGYTLRRR